MKELTRAEEEIMQILWQVTERGKSGTSDDSRKRLDIEYARTFNFWLDMKILLKTPLAALQHENV